MRLVLLIFLLLPVWAVAGLPEVRQTALDQGCTPKKIEIYSQEVGQNAQMIYQVECNVPKTVGDQTKTTNAILIRCRLDLCNFYRPVVKEEKKAP
ncbi:MAG: hypothetical protein EB121_08710 [Alphaproteobacteria bacterium]|nr:hypothetical protein [Alphaproteobacteria bacterium]NDG05407.1 hypothetical protein [Alphaproteobacteria bacterium]